MKIFFRKIYKAFLFVLLFSSINSFAASVVDVNSACKKIKNLIISKRLSNYSIPFNKNEQDVLKYQIVFDKKIAKSLIAACGNGGDSICEMSLIDADGGKIEFSLPVGIRLIEFQGHTYIVNGLIFDRNGDFHLNQYQVYQLRSGGINLICTKF